MLNWQAVIVTATGLVTKKCQVPNRKSLDWLIVNFYLIGDENVSCQHYVWDSALAASSSLGSSVSLIIVWWCAGLLEVYLVAKRIMVEMKTVCAYTTNYVSCCLLASLWHNAHMPWRWSSRMIASNKNKKAVLSDSDFLFKMQFSGDISPIFARFEK